MATATVTSKGQITIPIEIRVGLGLEAGDRINFMHDDLGRVVFLPVTKSITSLKGMVPKPKQSVSLENMKATITAKGG